MRDKMRPSSAALHMACHASANLPLAITGFEHPSPDPDKGQKGRGSLLHGLMEQIVQLPLNELRALIQALEWFQELRMQRRWKVLAEESLRIEWLIDPVTGTVDCILYLADEIHIIDWKFGRIEVSAIENEQTMSYGLAALEKGYAPKAKTVWLHIVQPLIDNYSSWEVSVEDLVAFQERMIDADQAIERGDVTFGPSDHCTFCPANPHARGDKGNKFCPELLQLYYPIKEDEDGLIDS